MKVAVTGSTGLVGTALISELILQGHEAIRLVRRKGLAGVMWDPESGAIERDKLEGVNAVVHLAGESIASGRWTQAKKARLRDSRVKGTRLLAETLAALNQPPQVLVSGSAMGIYGDRGGELLREDSAPGIGFLADLARQWEAATEPATRKGIRVVHLRTSLVLAAHGGALAKMLLPFKMGVGGVVGSGNQYMSWITLDDLVAAILHCIEAPGLHGPVNASSPSPVTNRQFTKALGRALHRPTIFPLPAFAARAALGQMADDLLLASTRLEPAKLLASRFAFQHKDIDSALRHVLKK